MIQNKPSVKNITGLSPMQEGILFHSLLNPDSSAYIEQAVISINDEIDPALFEKTFQKLIERYDILRTVFVYKTTKRPRQVVLDHQEAPVTIEDLSNRKKEELPDTIRQFIREDRQKGFDLTHGPLMRISLLKLDFRIWKLAWTFHHILMDGWCLGILLKDFLLIYGALSRNSSPLTEPVIPYNRYIKWLETRDLQKGLNYWKSALDGCEQPTPLPRLKTSPGNRQYIEGRCEYKWDETFSNHIIGLARDNQVTENTIFQALWGILLQKYNDSPDAVFGAVVSGRPSEIPGIDRMVGLFVNTIPIRITSSPNETFLSLLKQIHLLTLQSKSFEYIPLAEIQANTPLKNQLFDHILAFENYATDERIKKESGGAPGMGIRDVDMNEQTNYDLNLVVIPSREWKIKFLFNRQVFDLTLFDRIEKQLKEILRQVAGNRNIPIDTIDILPDEQKKELLEDFNKLHSTSYADKTIIDIFKDIVLHIPDHTAVVGESSGDLHHITYRELDTHARQLAEELKAKGIQPDSIVALLAHRSIEMIVSIMGILEAGAAYLPLDPEYPAERIDYMLKDSSAAPLRGDLLWHGVPVPSGGLLNGQPLQKEECKKGDSQENLNYQLTINNESRLAYVIYTSGTTGKPKGVMTTHRNVIRVVKDTNYIDITPQDRILQVSNYAFDGSIFDIFGALCSGAVLVLAQGSRVSGLGKLMDSIYRESITVFFVTTALFNSLVDLDTRWLTRIKKVLYGGERISIPHAKHALETAGKNKILHVYGPTETTVYASYYPIDSIDENRFTIPIGKPLTDTIIYILNKSMSLVPIGAVGELYIGGSCVARGYLNRPELTGGSFVKPPLDPAKLLFDNFNINKSFGKVQETLSRKGFLAAGGSSFYKTGDLGRWLSDGNIEFLGRADRQVKIRGFRIELGEIENRSREHASVKETVVIDMQGPSGDKYLCAYIVPAAECSGESEMAFKKELGDFLSLHLPAYMIPTYMVLLDQIPLTANGKLDKKALPVPGLESTQKQEPPAPGEEETIAEIWSEVLSIPMQNIARDSDFFRIGGHSLNAISVLNRIHKAFDVRLELSALFENPTVRELGGSIKSAFKEKFYAIEPVEDKEYYPLSSAQKRLYLIAEMTGPSTVYNISRKIPLGKDIDIRKIEETLLSLIARHESFRTSFHVVDGEPVQITKSFWKVQPHCVGGRLQCRDIGTAPDSFVDSKDIDNTTPKKSFGKVQETFSRKGFLVFNVETDEDAERAAVEMIKPFDLSQAPLIRAAIIKTSSGLFYLFLDMHHIISDGASEELFQRDFISLYNGIECPPLRLRYRDYAHWQNSEKQGEWAARQESYWLNILSGDLPLLNLPADFPRPAVQAFEGDTITASLGENLSLQLKAMALNSRVTVYMVLSALFFTLLSRLSGDEDIIVGTPVAGRMHADLKDIVGMFVNTLVIRGFPSHDKSLDVFIDEIKQQTLSAFENQDCQFENLVDKLVGRRDPSRNPLFDAMFTLMEADGANRQQPLEISQPGGAEAKEIQKPLSSFKNISKFDFTLAVVNTGQDILLAFEYCSKLFKASTIRRFIAYFKRIAGAYIQDPSQRIADIDIMDDEEKYRLLVEFNQTGADYPRDKTIHALFEEQAARTPDRIAIIAPVFDAGCPDHDHSKLDVEQITYDEFNRKSDIIAFALRERGVKLDTIVAITVYPCMDTYIGILGILKAGGAYLPLDPDSPAERIDYILKDSNATPLRGDLLWHGVPVPSGGLLNGQPLQKEECKKGYRQEISQTLPHVVVSTTSTMSTGSTSSTKVLSIINESRLAYIIYTSGTTGKPKGVMVEHRGLVNFISWRIAGLDFTPNDRTLQVLSPVFDGFASSFYSPLSSGGVMVLGYKRSGLDRDYLLDVMDKECITNTALIPSIYRLIVEGAEERNLSLRSFRLVVLAGEKAGENLVRLSRKINKNILLVNEYGPTENTVCTTFHKNIEPDKTGIIGKGIRNNFIIIVDKNGGLVPIGVSGEIRVTGDSLARGYLNRPELTRGSFVKPPLDPAKLLLNFDGDKSSIINHHSSFYKSGDLGRWLEDGNIEFLGRIDFQVKIRGYRVELGEIESVLSRFPGVKEAVVMDIVLPGGDKDLCGFIVSPGVTQQDEPYKNQIREYLEGSLPRFMVPANIVILEEIPLTANKKVDRRKLEVLFRTLGESVVSVSVRPGTETEEKLAAIWSRILNKEVVGIGIDDHFFQTGGNSLRAMTLVSRIHKEFGVRVMLTHVFKYPTIRRLASVILDRSRGEGVSPQPGFRSIQSVEEREYYPVSSPQRRLYLFQEIAPSSCNYNMPTAMVFPGPVDVGRFELVFSTLIGRHESLRTSFRTIDGQVVQVVHQDISFRMDYFEDGSDEAIQKYIRPFDLSAAPLLRVGLFLQSRGLVIMVVDMHHIVSDGVSSALLEREFTALLSRQDLPSLRIQYRDYAVWQHDAYGKSRDEYLEKESFWMKYLEGKPSYLPLPYDFQRPVLQDYQGRRTAFYLGQVETGVLKEIGNETGSTLYMVLMAVCSIWLSKLTGGEDIVMGTLVEGRNHADLKYVIGMFVNTLVMRYFPGPLKTFVEFLWEVKTKTLEAFEHQDYQFEDLVRSFPFVPDPGRNPLFDVLFTLQNMEADAQYIPGMKAEERGPGSQIPGEVRPYPLESTVSRFDLTIAAQEVPGNIMVSIGYSTSLFKAPTIERFAGYFKEIVEAVTTDRTILIKDIAVSHGLVKAGLENPEMELEF